MKQNRTQPVRQQPGLAPYAEAVGKRLRLVRQARKLTEAQAAAEVGTTEGKWKFWESGMHLPSAGWAERLVKWVWERQQFSGPPPAGPVQVRRGGEKWKRLRVLAPPDLTRRLRGITRTLGISQEEFILVAVERLLRNEPALTTMESAVDAVKKANVTALLAERPALVELLRGDLALALKVGAKRIEEEVPFPTERLARQALPGFEEEDDD